MKNYKLDLERYAVLARQATATTGTPFKPMADKQKAAPTVSNRDS